MLIQENILALYAKYWDHIDAQHKKLLLHGLMDQGMGPLEGFLVYFLVLEQNPRYAIELGPRFGYSTWSIGLALKALGKKNSFASFELQDIMRDTLIANLKRAELYPDYNEIVWGDASQTVVPFIKDKPVDFMWIDAAHTEEFADSYITRIFPVLQPGCLIGAHDMTANGRGNDGKFDLYKGIGAKNEEGRVKRYLLESSKDYSFFHAITGGPHSDGRSLPRNYEFYYELEHITKMPLIAEEHAPQCAYWRV